jgi:hypothetical protein
MVGIIKKIIQAVGKKVNKLKPKPKGWSKKSKNIGIKQAESEKLYKVTGHDVHGPIKIFKGERMPLDKIKYTERRPWKGPHSGHYGPKPKKKSSYRSPKSEGGLISGFPKIATKGWK